MQAEHQIRLHGPWQLSLRHGGADAPLEALGRFTAPRGLAECLPPGYCGLARLERSFHGPSGLTPHSQVGLRVTTNLNGQLSLNDQPLGHVQGGDNLYDVTSALQTRNRICLELVIDASPPMRQPSCDVRLEIRA